MRPVLFPHQSPTPLLFLAPMEGVLDFILREMITEIGGVDFCVSEFLRITHTLHSPAKMREHCPELLSSSRTKNQTPILFQLLGGDPSPLAENAAQAVELGALGIDLNFGCPAKTVNRHDGGAALLQFPERLFKIVEAVRKAVPAEIPVSSKMRLGFKDHSLLLENAHALSSGGSTWLTVHARTKLQGYAPPAHWQEIARVKDAVSIPVIANGDITSTDTLDECQRQSGCYHFMVGRTAIAQPHLLSTLSQHLKGAPHANENVSNKSLLVPFFLKSKAFRHGNYAMDRSKQWLRSLAQYDPELKTLFEKIKVITRAEDFFEALASNVGVEQNYLHRDAELHTQDFSPSNAPLAH